ncbi:WAS/WASL-interacting protein family member 3-like [Suricata suricatta]|uniref:WAS/WASL-interacting protein family member 3-like n=1 Tax=Suricata suricatta TaxID=37032 RepID=UPI00115578D5|nr:WAS/WASL-interacting protein family member 3-like [Suricata suricatta]
MEFSDGHSTATPPPPRPLSPRTPRPPAPDPQPRRFPERQHVPSENISFIESVPLSLWIGEDTALPTGLPADKGLLRRPKPPEPCKPPSGTATEPGHSAPSLPPALAFDLYPDALTLGSDPDPGGTILAGQFLKDVPLICNQPMGGASVHPGPLPPFLPAQGWHQRTVLKFQSPRRALPGPAPLPPWSFPWNPSEGSCPHFPAASVS